MTCASYGASAIAQIIFASPRPGESLIVHYEGQEVLKSDILGLLTAAVGLSIDLVLLAMPIAAVVGLQLPLKRKLGVVCIFMFGIL